MLARAVLVVGLVALAVSVAAQLSVRNPRLADTNHVVPAVFIVTVRGGSTLCQDAELVPGDAASVWLGIGTYGRPGPPLRLIVTAGGRTLTAGGLRAGWRQGNHVQVPVRRVRDDTPNALLCLRNEGKHRIAVAGEAGKEPVATIDRRPARGRVRLEYFRPGRDSWWSLIPTIAHRFGLGKSLSGAWQLWLTLALGLGAVLLGARLAWRELR